MSFDKDSFVKATDCTGGKFGHNCEKEIASKW